MNAPARSGLRVLVIDDERPALDELTYLLESDDRIAEVHATDSPTEALRLRGTLVPYTYTAARRAVDTGLPIAGPLFLRWPRQEAAYEHPTQFTFGRDLVVAPVGKPGLVEHPGDRGVDVLDVLQPGEEPQVLRHREPAIERRRLRHPADLARHRDAALVRLADPGEDREQGGLARAVGPDHGQQLARTGVEGDLAQGGAIAEALAEAPRLDHRRPLAVLPAHPRNATRLGVA